MYKYNPNYFTETSSSILDNENLREPQKQSYCKIYEHFVQEGKSSQAIIILPTGVGKTGLMAVAPYNICNGRTLIITPQLTVKDTVLGSLNTESHENFWSACKVLDEKDLPSIIEYENKKTINQVLELANIVIVNIQKLQGRLVSSLINRVPEDFFDMIIVDEAHHSTAKTWVEALHYFSQAKIIKLTATPLRSDGVKMSGELIYEYKLSQAMANNYVKSLIENEVSPDDVRFTIDNNMDVTYSLKEILQIKDEDWISRSVAYSDECSMQVINKSIELLKDKKSISNIPHKIIAVACSIKHAERIQELYASQGVRCSIVHSGMEVSEIDAVKTDIECNRTDVIVNVGMLGEGYDHKYLSIAAIFRPFRSELPYAQFIGRILRYIPESKNAGDNIGQVVSHRYLYLEELWQKYKIEMAESEIIRNLQDENVLRQIEQSTETKDISITDIGTVTASKKATITEDAYIQTKLLKKYKEESEEINIQAQQVAKILKISHEKAKQIIRQQKSNTSLARPDLVYNRSRKDIDTRIKEDIVPELTVKYIKESSSKNIKDCRLFQSGAYKWITKIKTPEGCLVAYFNKYLMDKIGKKREEWSIEEIQRANILLDNQTEYVAKILESFYD